MVSPNTPASDRLNDANTRSRCLVFGGSGAVGSAICRVLAREGAAIVFTYCTNENAAGELTGILPDAVAFRCDLTDFQEVKETVKRAVEHLGGLDAVIVATGTSGDPLFYKCIAPGNYDKLQYIDESAFDDMIAVNTRGPLAAC